MASDNSRRETVLVTGGSGFIGAHCILQLSQAGYRVQTTVRVPNLGVVRKASNGKARRLLDWLPRTNEEAILATARSLQQLGVLSQ